MKRLFWHDRHSNLKMFLVFYISPDNWHGNGVWYGCLDPGWRRDGVPAAVGSGAVVPGSEAQQLLQQLAAESGSFWTTRWPPSTAPAAPRAAATPASFWRNYRGRGRAWSWVWTPWTPPCPPLWRLSSGTTWQTPPPLPSRVKKLVSLLEMIEKLPGYNRLQTNY